MQLAIQKGLVWLSKQQKPDGSYGSESQYGRHVGITSLAALAFVESGSVPGPRSLRENVEDALIFVLDSASERSGLIAAGRPTAPCTVMASPRSSSARCTACRRGRPPQLQKAVAAHRPHAKRSWRLALTTIRADADLSVTICQVMALRSARNAGIEVPKSTIDRAIQYVHDSQNPDGGFRYMLDSAGSMFARSAAGVAALYYAGIHDDPSTRKGLGYLEKFMPGKTQEQTHYYYGQYYAAQAMFMAGGTHWEQWWPAIRDELLAKQSPDGFWSGEAGSEYGTAMALIVLQIPKQTLPIFQK
jgi:hypothetical protein